MSFLSASSEGEQCSAHSSHPRMATPSAEQGASHLDRVVAVNQQLQSEGHRLLRFRQASDALVIHAAIPDQHGEVAVFALVSASHFARIPLLIREGGRFPLGASDLEQLFRPVKHLRLGVANVRHAVKYFKHSRHCDGGLLQKDLQCVSETLLHDFMLWAGLLLKEEVDVEIEGVRRDHGLRDFRQFRLECRAAGVHEGVKLELVQKAIRCFHAVVLRLLHNFTARGDHAQAVLHGYVLLCVLFRAL